MPREEYDKVVALEWKRSGVRSFFLLPHGGIPRYTYSLESATRVSESFWRGCLNQLPQLRDAITSWRLMTEEEAAAWVSQWPWLEDGKIVPASIPYWSHPI
jgi:hypothetical protein